MCSAPLPSSLKCSDFISAFCSIPAIFYLFIFVLNIEASKQNSVWVTVGPNKQSDFVNLLKNHCLYICPNHLLTEKQPELMQHAKVVNDLGVSKDIIKRMLAELSHCFKTLDCGGL